MRRTALIVCILLALALPVQASQQRGAHRSVLAEPHPPNSQEIRRIRRTVSILSNFNEHFAFSPDGTRIAAAGSETTVNVWHVDTGDIIYTLAHAGTSVSWSPDGRWIAAGTFRGPFRVWDAATGALAFELDSDSGRHSSWAPDSRRFVTNAMNIHDGTTGAIITELGLNWNIPYEAHWSPDGTMIATTGNWGRDYMHLWSSDGERLDTFWAGTSAAWSPDSTRLASAYQVRDVATGLPVMVIPEMVGVIAWHPDGEWISSATADGVFLWDAETGGQVTVWPFGDCQTRGFAWSPDGQRFALNCLRLGTDPGYDLVVGELAQ